jgi:hypothetical protein
VCHSVAWLAEQPRAAELTTFFGSPALRFIHGSATMRKRQGSPLRYGSKAEMWARAICLDEGKDTGANRAYAASR